jgi:hypothetical protein
MRRESDEDIPRYVSPFTPEECEEFERLAIGHWRMTGRHGRLRQRIAYHVFRCYLWVTGQRFYIEEKDRREGRVP